MTSFQVGDLVRVRERSEYDLGTFGIDLVTIDRLSKREEPFVISAVNEDAGYYNLRGVGLAWLGYMIDSYGTNMQLEEIDDNLSNLVQEVFS